MTFDDPQPVREAIDALLDREVVTTFLGTEDISRIELAARRRAFFSARVESAELLQRMRELLRANISLEVEDGRATIPDRSRFVNEVRAMAETLGLRPETAEDGRGGLGDIGSQPRLELIFKTQLGLAYGHARLIADSHPVLLRTRPAWELVRVEQRREPRDWQARWVRLGRDLVEDGRMIARKDDPIWVALSRFDLPYPPFDFNSGMGLLSVSFVEARRLGIVDNTTRVQAPDARLEEEIRASVGDLPEDLRSALELSFAGVAQVEGDQLLTRPQEA